MPGVLGGWGLAITGVWLRRRDAVGADLGAWSAVCAVLIVYGLTEVAGGYGVLAAFAGGIVFRRYERDHERNEQVHAGALRIERILEFGMIILLGTVLTVGGLGAPGWWGWALAIVLTVVIRPLACAIGLVGARIGKAGLALDRASRHRGVNHGGCILLPSAQRCRPRASTSGMFPSASMKRFVGGPPIVA